jgi:hypothetical protein
MGFMTVPKLAPALLFAISAAAAEMPLPVLRIEPAPGGSVFYVKNASTQPLTAYLIELVNYPGSSYSLWQEEITGQPVAPGAEKRIPVNNMTVGAVPDYVKLQAALFADGSSSGIPEKVAQLVERRRALLDTTRQLLGRLEKAGTPKAGQADLKQWADSMQPSGRPNRNSQAFINQSAARGLIADTIAGLDRISLEDTLTSLKANERALAAGKPPL